MEKASEQQPPMRDEYDFSQGVRGKYAAGRRRNDMSEVERRIVEVQQKVLSKNDVAAAANRARFSQAGVLVLNVVSSPGSGKTALLERLLADLSPRLRIAVVVGDLQTDNDARRLRGKGAPVEQITTGTVCHLDAPMVARAVSAFDLDALDVLIIENVGNLVCPASYDLGEDLRVALLSVTEGEDKPLKYPGMFKSAHLVVVNKIDIAEVVGFDRAAALASIHGVAPQAKVVEVSARTGAGVAEIYAWIDAALHRLRSRPVSSDSPA